MDTRRQLARGSPVPIPRAPAATQRKGRYPASHVRVLVVLGLQKAQAARKLGFSEGYHIEFGGLVAGIGRFVTPLEGPRMVTGVSALGSRRLKAACTALLTDHASTFVGRGDMLRPKRRSLLRRRIQQ